MLDPETYPKINDIPRATLFILSSLSSPFPRRAPAHPRNPKEKEER
ncbi:MAG: hypothetical protein LBI02_05150 [Opitutaceae bacterium]|nr:hypothetical protein [Opitutaceae bacterium]